MKRKIYEYIKENGVTSINEITLALDAQGIDITKMLESLREEGFVKMCHPLPLRVDSDNSCFYTITGKVYTGE